MPAVKKKDGVYKCSACGLFEYRQRVLAPNGDTRFVNKEGRRWKTLRCPDCYAAINRRRVARWSKKFKSENPDTPLKNKQRATFTKEVLLPGEEYVKIMDASRRCKQCNAKTNNYHYCRYCNERRAAIFDVADDWIFCGW